MEKRRREQVRRQKQLDKQERSARRTAQRRLHPELTMAKDADLAEMKPGPQPGQIISGPEN